MGWVTNTSQNKRVIEMRCATGTIYLGDPRIDKSHLISSHCGTKYTLHLSHLVAERSDQDFIDSSDCVDPHGRVVSYIYNHSLPSISQTSSGS
jgi:hypothetical protein